MRSLTGTITCKEMVGTQTHYYRGRTIPCDSESCPACDDGFPWRWHGYVSLYCPGSHRQSLFEFTAKAAEPLTAYLKTYGTLRGCQICAKRANASANARVTIQTRPGDLEKIQLPKEPNLLEALSIIWGIEMPAIVVDGINKGNPNLDIRQDHDNDTNRIRKVLDHASGHNPNGNGKSQ